MDDLGFNKIAAALLATALGYIGLKEISHLAFHTNAPEVPAYALALPEVSNNAEVAEVVPFPSPEWIASLDSVKGAKVFKKCTSCHSVENNGKNGTGPNLYGVVGKAAAQTAGFKYSSAMKGAGITWDYETLDGFLAAPKKYLSGTAMAYVGLKKEKDRAAVIEYLRQASDTPLAQPVAAVKPAMEAEAAPMDENMMEDKTPEAMEEAPMQKDESPAEGEH